MSAQYRKCTTIRDPTDQQFALKGFFNGNYFPLSKTERLELVLRQLRKYYGNSVEGFKDYLEMVWRNEPFTFRTYQSHILPHQNNGHKLYHQSYLNGRLFIGGSETAPQFPGYMGRSSTQRPVDRRDRSPGPAEKRHAKLFSYFYGYSTLVYEKSSSSSTGAVHPFSAPEQIIWT